jgi:AraC-like DNA-binding protein
VKPGWVVFCLPESPHQVRSGAGDWEHRWITFDGPRAADIVSAFKIPGKPFQADICGGVFERLKRLLDDSSLDGERAAGVELYSFLSFLSAKAAGSVPGGGDSLETLLSKIQERIGDPDLSVKTLSDETGLSRFTIHRIFQEEMGVSPKRHIDAMRLRKAMSLLRERGASVEEAALAAGFANANYFSKFFRKKTSVTPAAFRAAGVMP